MEFNSFLFPKPKRHWKPEDLGRNLIIIPKTKQKRSKSTNEKKTKNKGKFYRNEKHSKTNGPSIFQVPRFRTKHSKLLKKSRKNNFFKLQKKVLSSEVSSPKSTSRVVANESETLDEMMNHKVSAYNFSKLMKSKSSYLSGMFNSARRRIPYRETNARKGLEFQVVKKKGGKKENFQSARIEPPQAQRRKNDMRNFDHMRNTLPIPIPQKHLEIIDVQIDDCLDIDCVDCIDEFTNEDKGIRSIKKYTQVKKIRRKTSLKKSNIPLCNSINEESRGNRPPRSLQFNAFPSRRFREENLVEKDISETGEMRYPVHYRCGVKIASMLRPTMMPKNTKKSLMEKQDKSRKLKEFGNIRGIDGGIPCLLMEPDKASDVLLLYFHANAEDINQAYNLCSHISKKLHVSVF